jgi:hypothetical protein
MSDVNQPILPNAFVTNDQRVALENGLADLRARIKQTLNTGRAVNAEDYNLQTFVLGMLRALPDTGQYSTYLDSTKMNDIFSSMTSDEESRYSDRGFRRMYEDLAASMEWASSGGETVPIWVNSPPTQREATLFARIVDQTIGRLQAMQTAGEQYWYRNDRPFRRADLSRSQRSGRWRVRSVPTGR